MGRYFSISFLHPSLARRPFFDLLQHAAQQAARQRAPGDHAQAVGLAGRDDFQFDHAVIQVVQALFADQTHEMAGFCSFTGPDDVPAGKVGRANIDHLALLDEHFHRLPDLFPGGETVDVVHLVQVNVVGLQALERTFHSLADVQGREL